MAFDVRTVQTTLENLLHDSILFALGQRVGPFSSVVQLRTWPTRGQGQTSAATNDWLASVVATSTTGYRWNQQASAADNGTTVIQPNDVPAGSAGRWVAWTSQVRFSVVVGGNDATLDQITSGTLRRVLVIDQQMSDDEVKALLNGVAPAVFIEAHGDRPTDATLNIGHRWLSEFEFTISVLAQNLRGQRQAAQGSSIDGTLGANDLDGFIQALLCGTNLYAATGQGIRNVRLGRGSNWKSRIAQRSVVRSREYLVQATVEFPNAPNDTAPITDVIAQPQLASLDSNADQADPQNYLKSGMAVVPAVGLSQAVGAGSAVIAGSAVSYAGQAQAFSAYMDTYRDLLPNGSMVFVAVANQAPPPAVTATALRIGFTRTNGTSVTDDVILAATLANYGSAFDIQI